MEKKFKIIFTIISLFVFLSISLDSFAQYTIPDKTQKEIQITPVRESVLKHDSTGFSTVNNAYLRYQRAQRRKARNFFQFSNGLTISQFAYANWAAGGKNNFQGKITSAMTHSFTEKKFNVTTIWDAAYAMQTIEGKLWKTEDRFQINPKFNYQMYKKLYYSFSADLRSQFSNGYANLEAEEPNSRPFSPATLNLSVGINYKIDDSRSIMVSPVSGNMLISANKKLAPSFGIEDGKQVKSGVGLNVSIIWGMPIIKDKSTSTPILTYKTNTVMFYKYGGTPYLNWQSWVEYTMFKYFKLNFFCNLIYDFDVAPREGFKSHWQFQESAGIGIAYVFKNK